MSKVPDLPSFAAKAGLWGHTRMYRHSWGANIAVGTSGGWAKVAICHWAGGGLESRGKGRNQLARDVEKHAYWDVYWGRNSGGESRSREPRREAVRRSPREERGRGARIF